MPELSKSRFITGASTGLGEALATQLLAKGGRVGATFRQPEQVAAFTQRASGHRLSVLADVTNTEQLAAAVQQALSAFGHLAVMVNNAGNDELFPGLRTVASAAHTPGHSFYALESQGQKLLFWGDMVHVAAVQLARPAVTIRYAADSPQAAAVRQQALAEGAQAGYLVAISHFSFPGIGHVHAGGRGYTWSPLNYRYNPEK